jgi:VanZ family protein
MLALLFAPRFARWRLGCAFTLYGAILLIGSLPGARAGIGDYASGLLLHALAYGGLAFLLFTGCAGPAARRCALACVAVMLMGALDEWVQSFFPYRHASVGDWLVDCGAAALASALLWLTWARWRST